MLSKINSKIESIGKKQEFALIVILSAFMVFVITIGIGTLTCGWHLVDDHEFLKMIYQMKFEGKTIFSLMQQWVKGDMVLRYRPLYYPERIIYSALFGVNLIDYALFRSVEIVIANIFLYYCGRFMGAGKVYSFLFAVISLTGYQSVVWWKLGPQEALGTAVFAVGFFCVLKWLRSGRIGWAFGSIASILFVSNYKESYILLIPFVMLYVLYSDIIQKGGQILWKRIWECIKSRLWYYLILGMIFVIFVLIIIFYVGVSSYDGAGLDATIPWETYVEAFKSTLASDLKWFKRFGIIFILILLTYWEELKKMWKELLLVTVFLLPQIIIYGQSGISERYILPSSIGYALFFIILVPQRNILSGKRKALYQFCILLLLLAHTRVAMREADYFRFRGESVTTMLETVKDMTQQKEDIKILSCFRPNEEGNLTINYWLKIHGYDNVYYWTEEDKIINQVCDINFIGTYTQEQLQEQPFEDMDVVVMYNQEDRHWCYTPSLELSDFTELKCGTLTFYIRNDSGIALPDTSVNGLKINF